MKKSERYSTGGAATGVVGIVVVAVYLVVAAVDGDIGFPAWGYPVGLAFIVLAWAIMIRPAVCLHEDEVELRNVLHSRWIPYVAVTDVEIRQVTTIHVGERRYVGSGLGRTRRTIHRDHARGPDARPEDHSLGWLVESRIRREAEKRQEFASGETPAVRRTPRWPEAAAVLVLVVLAAVLAVA